MESTQRMTKRLKRCNRRKQEENHAMTMKEVNCSPLLMLPADLIIAILTMLPIYTILSCKCVCNKLRQILSDPYFAKVHLAKTLGNDCNLVIQDLDFSSNIVLAPMFDLDKPAMYSKGISVGGCHAWQTLSSPNSIPDTASWDKYSKLIGSCNGLLSFKYKVHEKYFYCVCNPVLGEFTILPPVRQFNTLELSSFGFCPKTNKYKILRFFPKLGQCEILTLGSDKWRKLGDFRKHPHAQFNRECYYKGNIHFIVNYTREEWIFSFSLESEDCCYMSLPACLYADSHPKLSNFNLGTFDGLFCLSFVVLPGYFEVHVMENYGYKESWIKKLSIDLRYHFNFDNIMIIRFLDNGALVVRYSTFHTTSVVYYNTRNETTSDVDTIDKHGCFCAVANVPSLISLKDIVGRENVEEVERKMLHFFSSKARVHC